MRLIYQFPTEKSIDQLSLWRVERESLNLFFWGGWLRFLPSARLWIYDPLILDYRQRINWVLTFVCKLGFTRRDRALSFSLGSFFFLSLNKFEVFVCSMIHKTGSHSFIFEEWMKRKWNVFFVWFFLLMSKGKLRWVGKCIYRTFPIQIRHRNKSCKSYTAELANCQLVSYSFFFGFQM